MELIDKSIPYKSAKETFKIYFIADQHIGSKGCDEHKIKRDIDRVASEPNSYWIQGGDAIDGIVPSDLKRFDPTTIDPKFLTDLDNICHKQIEHFMSLYEPIKDKCLGVHRGNHEEHSRKYYHYDVLGKVCIDWAVPELKDTAMLRLKFVRSSPGLTAKPSSNVITIFSAHGNVAGRRSGGKVNRLEALMGQFDADIYFLAHGHKKITHSASMLTVPKGGELKLLTKKKVGAMTGSYLRSYQEGSTCYAEKGMYAPSDLGCVAVRIKPFEREFGFEG